MYYSTFIHVIFSILPNIDCCSYIYNYVYQLELEDSLKYWKSLSKQKHTNNHKFKLLIYLINSDCLVQSNVQYIPNLEYQRFNIPNYWSFFYKKKYQSFQKNINEELNYAYHTNTDEISFKYDHTLYTVNLRKKIMYRKAYIIKDNTSKIYTFGYRTIRYTYLKSRTKWFIYNLDQQRIIYTNSSLKQKLYVYNLFERYKLLQNVYRYYHLFPNPKFIIDKNKCVFSIY